jgi:hypothetical protein
VDSNHVPPRYSGLNPVLLRVGVVTSGPRYRVLADILRKSGVPKTHMLTYHLRSHSRGGEPSLFGVTGRQ